jgi:hypothetical protein
MIETLFSNKNLIVIQSRAEKPLKSRIEKIKIQNPLPEYPKKPNDFSDFVYEKNGRVNLPGAQQCKYIFGKIKSEMRFCQKNAQSVDVVGGKINQSYCAEHYALCNTGYFR